MVLNVLSVILQNHFYEVRNQKKKCTQFPEFYQKSLSNPVHCITGCVFVTNSHFLIPISLQTNVVDL